ncbi:MAG TPA: flagellin FliC [Bdellovibrionales bacterium]|nr:MAG: flagellin [Bdellovibrionales bacterium GWB1_52_6]OFZ03617.1 MAG: flagellin [Bdellovibrionales bacterium GWA1_52_35]OFZ34928.1 MAG: flagellin [Bdellovibrionales bacterium GWC1_52_8]HAR42416.1 flagellin FliC [Bdellovibrionales bacterium]HCM40659.1 flagellin FliC [Bdellovibrionales bacterium]
MSLRIATNVQALAAQRNLNINNEKSAGSLERLSSGSRINKAGDDAAGLAISEKLKANIRSMKQATRNANDGISLVQTAEGAMNEIGSILVRLRELSIQSASDTIGQTERGFVDKEVQALKSEINRISNVTEFNGTKLLNGTAAPLDIQVGLTNDPELDRFVFDTPTRVTTLDALGISDVSTTDKVAAQNNLVAVDNAIVRLNENRSSLGALQNRLMSTINNMSIYRENLEGANSRIRDTDMAEETSELVKNNILTQANISVLGQANQMPNLVMKLLG